VVATQPDGFPKLRCEAVSYLIVVVSVVRLFVAWFYGLSVRMCVCTDTEGSTSARVLSGYRRT
jgi:hypothetical protein